MKKVIYEIKSNDLIAQDVYKCELTGDTSAITAPGQFVNIKIEGLYLRRPISVCDCKENCLTIIYKVVGTGTEKLSKMCKGDKLDTLTGLGNGYSFTHAGNTPLLIGGGVGVPPMYLLCKKLIESGKSPTVVLGFNTKSDVFFEDEFKNLGVKVFTCTADGSYGIKGFVTDIVKDLDYSFFYTCGPEPMFKALSKIVKTEGQYSFEERMGCGFGACMGCSCKTLTGNKRICKEGPVMDSGEIIWND